MDHNVWYEIKKQIEETVDQSSATSVEELKSGSYNPASSKFFQSIFRSSNDQSDQVIPLSYYTKPCAWAADYPLTHRRVLIYLNPSHLASHDSLDKYVISEFGCTKEIFKQFIREGWFIPMLNTYDKYDRHSSREITNLFDDISGATVNGHKILPRYVGIIDLALGTAFLESKQDNEDIYSRSKTPAGDEYVDIHKTYKRQKRESPWNEISTAGYEGHGVEHDSHRDYIVERAFKLRLIDDVVGESLSSESNSNLSALYNNIASRVGEDSEENLTEEIYANWNLIGAPVYYCDFSGTTDMGKSVAQTHRSNTLNEITNTGDNPGRFTENINTTVEEVKLTLESITERYPSYKFDMPRFNSITKQAFNISPESIHETDDEKWLQKARERAEAHEKLYKQGSHQDINIWRRSEDIEAEFDSRTELRKHHNSKVRDLAPSDPILFSSIREGETIPKLFVYARDAAALLPGLNINRILTSVKFLGGLIFIWERKGVDRTEIETEVAKPENECSLDNLGNINYWSINYGNTNHHKRMKADGGQDQAMYVTDADVI